jgi:hypothetical protein
MNRSLRVIALAVVLLCTAGAAFGSDARTDAPPPNRKIIGILDVRVEGMPAEAAARFEAKLESQLDTGHYWLAPRKRMEELLAGLSTWSEGCLSGPCLAQVKNQTGASMVLTVYFHGSGTSFSSVITLLRTDTGEVVTQHSERCEVCTVNEAVDQSILATMGLVGTAPDDLPDDLRDTDRKIATAVKPLRVAMKQVQQQQRSIGVRLTLVGAATLSAGIAIRLLYKDKASASYGVMGAGAGIALSGLTVLTF